MPSAEEEGPALPPGRLQRNLCQATRALLFLAPANGGEGRGGEETEGWGGGQSSGSQLGFASPAERSLQSGQRLTWPPLAAAEPASKNKQRAGAPPSGGGQTPDSPLTWPGRRSSFRRRQAARLLARQPTAGEAGPAEPGAPPRAFAHGAAARRLGQPSTALTPAPPPRSDHVQSAPRP